MGLESIFKLSVILNLIDNISSPLKQTNNNTSQFVQKMQQASSTFSGITQAGAAMAMVGKGITEGVLEPVQATFETRKAIGELASVGVQDLGLIEDAAKQFSNTWAGTTKADFITAAYDIKSGISSLTDEGVAQYTELAGLTAKATKSTVTEMSDLFATGYGIYKDFYSDLSDVEFGEVFSAGIANSVQKFKTNGSEMASAIKNLGASATSAQVPLEEQLSVLGMLQATMGGSEAGTKYRAFLKSAANGGEELGLSFLDANNQLKSMPEIMDQLRGKFGETMDAAEKMELQQAFGDSEAVALIELMYGQVDTLQDNILSLYDSMGSGTGVAREMANAINETEPDKYQRIQQQIQNVKESIGNSLLPTVNEFLTKGAETLTKVDTWVSKNQELVRIIMLVVLALGGFLTVGGTAVAIIGGIGLAVTKTAGMIGMFKSGIGTLAKTVLPNALAALSPLIASVWSFTAALLANPITWIVIGIVALIAGLVLLYNKCEWFRNLVDGIISWIGDKVGGLFDIISNVFSGIKDALNLDAAAEKVKGAFSAIGDFAGSALGAARDAAVQNLSNMKQAYDEHGGGIKGAAFAALEGVKGIYQSGFNFIDNLTGGKLSGLRDKFKEGFVNIKDYIFEWISGLKESGKKIWTTFTEGIMETVKAPVEAVKGGLQKIRDMLPFSDAKTGPLDSLTLSGNRVMTTLQAGIEQSEDAPAKAVQNGFEKIDITATNDNLYKGSKSQSAKPITAEAENGSVESESSGKKTVIRQLNINIDFNKIKELPKLIRLLEELEDYVNGSGENEGEPELTYV